MSDPEIPVTTFQRAGSILGAVAYAADVLVTAASWRDPLPDIFRRVGEAADVSRVYLFENAREAEGSLVMSQVMEWTGEGVSPTIDDPENQAYPYARGFQRWEALMSTGKVLHGLRRDMPEAEQVDMESEGILSMACVPVFAGDEWWGFIGFDDCRTERDWSDLELQTLRAAAGTLGAAIERERIAGRLAEAESRYKTHVEHLPAITYIEYTDAESRLGYSDVYVSPQIESILGYTQEWWLQDREGSAWNEIVHPDDVERVEEEARRTAITKDPFVLEYRVRRRDGSWAWMRDESYLFEGEADQPYWHGVMIDITDRKSIEEQLREAEERYRTLVEQIPAILYVEPVNDEDADLRYVSPQVDYILGCGPVEWLHHPAWWHDHIHPDDRDLVWERHLKERETGRLTPQEYRMVREDGREVWIRDDPKLIRHDDGRPWLIQGLLHDVTERKEAEAEIEFLAYHDRLTGLANRALFEAMLEPAMARARRRNLGVAVLFMDLDGFKDVNDTLGHAVGDELLRQVAGRLTASVRETDLVARQGGDEFLVMLADLDLAPGDVAEAEVEEHAVRLARRTAERIHEAMAEAFRVGDHDLHTSVSIGISVFPMDAVDERALMKNSDSAMYESKESQRGGSTVHGERTDERLTKLSFPRRLRAAVKEQTWVLHYQPVVELASGRVVAAEALLRWRKPAGGLIPPAEFLPIAEEMGLLEIIGEWVLEELCRQATVWRSQGVDLDLSFNLSPRQLWQRDLAAGIQRVLAEADVAADSICVEVPESAAMADPARAIRVLGSLREIGMLVALDDFGTGYTPPVRLRDLPIDILKIDGPLVRDVADEAEVADFVHAVVGFASELGVRSLAEGIETRKQLRILRGAGCVLGQGYLFSRPVPPEGIPELARAGFADQS
ncbi:MAG: EAL domain-containing protein [Actinomycetota bacterium]